MVSPLLIGLQPVPGTQAHCPFWHWYGAGQEPQFPLQPSFPHSLPWHWGWQTQPPDSHVHPDAQEPHKPPQPFGPHSLPPH